MPQPNEINEYYTPKTLCFQGFPVFLNIFLKILKIMLDKQYYTLYSIIRRQDIISQTIKYME